MSDRIYAVDIDFIDAFNESARSTYPDEFLCMTREIDGIISEIMERRCITEEEMRSRHAIWV